MAKNDSSTPTKRDQTVHPANAAATPDKGLSLEEATDVLQDVEDMSRGETNDLFDNWRGKPGNARDRLRESGDPDDAHGALLELLTDAAPDGETDTFDAGDESGESDTDADGGDDDDADTDEDDSDDADEPVKFHEFSEQELDTPVRITRQGEEQYVPLREIIRDGMRGRDYTIKTQHLAETRKAAEAARAEHQTHAETLAVQLGVIEQYVQTLPPQAREGLAQMRQAAATQAAALQAAAMHSILEQENVKLRTALNVESDSEMAAIKSELVKGARDLYGFEDSALEGVTDHRALLILRDAIAYRQSKSRGKDVLRGTRKRSMTLQPGIARQSSSATRKARSQKAAMSQLRSTGRVDDAAAAFMALDLD